MNRRPAGMLVHQIPGLQLPARSYHISGNHFKDNMCLRIHFISSLRCGPVEPYMCYPIWVTKYTCCRWYWFDVFLMKCKRSIHSSCINGIMLYRHTNTNVLIQLWVQWLLQASMWLSGTILVQFYSNSRASSGWNDREYIESIKW